MSHFQQHLTINATPAAVYAALTTPAGLRAWWTEDCDVSTELGGTIQFRFGPNVKNMRIEKLEPSREVRWYCTHAHMVAKHLARSDEWVGTEIVFALTPEGEGRTRVHFEHIGLAPALSCYELCRNGWQYFMLSLQQYAETGRGTPYPLNEAEAA